MTSVLIVDDEPSVRELMVRWATSLGLSPRTAANADEAVQALQSEHCDLAVIDVMMPGKTGLWLAGELRRDHPHTAVILATGYANELEKNVTPVADFLVKPFKRDRFMLAVDRGREWRRQAVEELEWHAQLAAEMRARVQDIQSSVAAARQQGADEVDTLVEIARARTPDVMEHSERVARYTVSIARELALDQSALMLFEQAALFHDIGKAATPEPVLTKPSPLTASEAAIMRRHVDAGADILAGTRTLQSLAPIVLASHEWFGGAGYPHRLSGTGIPLASRIISVADAYDAMTQDRQYRSRLDSAEAVSELLRGTPRQFDPDIVVTFLNVLNRH